MSTVHECIIGLLYGIEDSRLITLLGLMNHIEDNLDFNKFLDSNPIYKNSIVYKKVYTLEDYGDKRKSTNLRRFDYCPECGRAIDWKFIRRFKYEFRKDQ